MTGSRATALIADPSDPLTAIVERALAGHGPVLPLSTEATEDELCQAALRRRGVPYTVVQAAPLAEEVLRALAPSLERGRLHLVRGRDPVLTLVSREDLATCVAAALRDDGCCGRTLPVAAPERLALSRFAARAAAAQGRRLRVTQVPRWAARPLAALGRRPFDLPAQLVRELPREDLAALHPGPWQEVEALVGAATATTPANPVGTAQLAP